MTHQNNNGQTDGTSSNRIKVLRYDRIVDSNNPECKDEGCISLGEFRHHLDLFELWRYTPITFDDYRLSLKGEIGLPSKPIILTFDHAYEDNYLFSFPVMQKFGVKGVVFASGNRQISQTDAPPKSSLPSAHLMSDQALLEMHTAGFEIGSHGLGYTNLTHLSTEKASEEISRSRVLLEILLNAPVLTFAYPFGAVTPVVKQLVAQSGYTIGCGLDAGPRLFTSDPFEIRRVSMMKHYNAVTLHAKLLFA